MTEEEHGPSKRPKLGNGVTISPIMAVASLSGEQRSAVINGNGNPSSPTPSSGGPSVGEPPCAACKSLRRKCTKDCIFLPYFPRDDPEKFARVHKVFGASNVAKMLQELPLQQREDAVASLEYEAQARVQDPVYGCVGILCVLQRQVATLRAQLAEAQSQAHVSVPVAIGFGVEDLHPTEPSSGQQSTSTMGQKLSNQVFTCSTVFPATPSEQAERSIQMLPYSGAGSNVPSGGEELQDGKF